MQNTINAYQIQREQMLQRSMSRAQTSTERRDAAVLRQDIDDYLRRLLSAYGWPTDLRLRATLAAALDEPEVQWCAGQAALRTAITIGERAQGARLIDQALIGLDRQQRYGTVTKVVGRWVRTVSLENAQGVDARRAAIGLPPLAQTIAELQAKLLPRPAPSGLKRTVVLRAACQPFTTQAALNTPLTRAQIDALAAEADRLVEQDQVSRKQQVGARPLSEVDTESIEWLKMVLRRFGWPSINRSEAQLATNVWLLTQHADRAPALQKCVADLIDQQQSSLREAQHLAYLTDRVRVNYGQLQVYGTQITVDVQGNAIPKPLEDGVDERRIRIGLEPIKDYLKLFEP
ncbi:hypothetical protein GO986_17155, partial [Deinococcus sp. HMF7620]